MISFSLADLFCGAGGSSTASLEAIEAMGMKPKLTAINHWPVAVATHEKNHPESRHRCACLDSLNPHDLYGQRELDYLWGSPSCRPHSPANSTKPINDQDRVTAWCIVRWAEALLPPRITVENVPQFRNWGPLGANGRPLKSRRGETFEAWLNALRALGYTVEHRVLCAADYGDPQTRRRLFVHAVRGKLKIVWPNPTHHESGAGGLLRWVPARSFIEWHRPMRSIFNRKKDLSPNTLRRIAEGLESGAGAFIVAMEHGGRLVSIDKPLPTVTTAKGGAFGLAYVLGQHGGSVLRSADKPVPTITADGAVALIVEYYGNGRAHSIDKPLPTVTCRDRFALIKAQGGDVLFRMFADTELAAAQSFLPSYQFTGNVQERTKQIGNAVPRRLARALVAANVSQNPDVSWLTELDKAA